MKIKRLRQSLYSLINRLINILELQLLASLLHISQLQMHLLRLLCVHVHLRNHLRMVLLRLRVADRNVVSELF